ncbi:flavin reductase family protein [Ramlibacter sp.]|uniref:flavin reductase family protein n=1 Tax=Ramlibacter sp. TaxID=1917967 RepID=UPI003D0BAFAA
MEIRSSDLNNAEMYKLLTGVVVPRPIAWITTMSEAGVVNLAPFSAFTYVCSRPPMLGFNCGQRTPGVRKDTARNIFANREYVVHVVDNSLLHVMHESSEEHPPEVSEPDLLGLEYIPSVHVKVPRLVAPRVAMECRFHDSMRLGERAEFIVGEVVLFHVRDDIIVNGKIETEKLDPVARLGGPRYATLGPVQTLRVIEQSAQKTPNRTA